MVDRTNPIGQHSPPRTFDCEVTRPVLTTDTATNATADSTTVAQMQAWVDAFANERSWERYHSPKNLAVSIAIEAAELLEHFQWSEGPNRERLANEASPTSGNPEKGNGCTGVKYRGELQNHSEVAEELSDVLAYLLRLASVLDIDLANALQAKMRKNAIKYPVDVEHRFG